MMEWMKGTKEEKVRKIVRCTCGVELRNDDEQQLIRDVQMHAREAHDLALNDEQVRVMMVIDQEGDT